VIVSLIVAMDENRGIGLRGGLPWHLSTDLKRFKSLTIGHHILMGRKTFESIGRALPGREMIVVSRNPGYRAEGCLVVHSIEEGLEAARYQEESELFIIGGREIFEQALPYAMRIYLTQVHTAGEVDTFFPEINLDDWWVVDSSSFPAGENDDFPTTFKRFESKH
jgi:dihydrofolate reductase